MAIPSTEERFFHIRKIGGKNENFLSFKILENTGNGDCLYMSLMQFLKHDDIHEIPNDVTDLRHRIVDYISHISNWHRFMDTIIFNLENLVPRLRKHYSDDVKRKEYRNYMRQPYQYGTFAELQAASEIYSFVYIVFRKEIQKLTNGSYETWYNCYSSQDHKAKSKMFLYFSGKPSSGHFKFMRPVLPKTPYIIPHGDYKTMDRRYGPNNSLILSVKKAERESSNGSNMNGSVCPMCGRYE